MTTLADRTSKARAAILFSKVVSSNAQQQPTKVLVPGSEGKRYTVTLRRNGTLSVSCMCNDNGMSTRCKGSLLTVCYHGMAALIFAAEHGGKCVSFCETEQDAQRLIRTGGNVYKVDSVHANSERYHGLWIVVKDCKQNSEQANTDAPATTQPTTTTSDSDYTAQEWLRAEELAAEAAAADDKRWALLYDANEPRPERQPAAGPECFLEAARTDLIAQREYMQLETAQRDARALWASD